MPTSDQDTVLDVSSCAGGPDAITAARPGARRESAETYIKRLAEKLRRNISNAMREVELHPRYRLNARAPCDGRPEKISDAGYRLAHDIAKRDRGRDGASRPKSAWWSSRIPRSTSLNKRGRYCGRGAGPKARLPCLADFCCHGRGAFTVMEENLMAVMSASALRRQERRCHTTCIRCVEDMVIESNLNPAQHAGAKAFTFTTSREGDLSTTILGRWLPAYPRICRSASSRRA